MGGFSYTKKQQEVIDLRHANLIVSAAAGSGKTAVLTARIISLLTDEKEPVDIDRMLIVTFTKAAAAEMRERIGKAIGEYCAEHPEDIRMERQGTLLYNAQITTIDSFCLWVVRNHFSEIALDPGFRIIDEGEGQLLFQDVMEELLEEEYLSRKEDFLHLMECYCPDGQESTVTEILADLYRYAMSHPWPEKWLQQAAEDMCTDGPIEESTWYPYLQSRADRCILELKKTAEEARALAQAPDGPSGYLAFAEACVALAGEMAEESSHDRRVRILDTAEIPSMKGGKKKNEDEEIRERAKALLELCKELIRELREYYLTDSETCRRLRQQISGNASALVRLTLALAERFAAAKRERNAVDFSDMEHFALKILLTGENGIPVPTESAKEYRDYFACVCVDEYQDSNYVQEYILKSVAREDNYFCVGDIKQSIYRFRLARPEIFLKNYAGSGDEGIDRRIDLNQNFRSRAEVLDFINVIFRQIMRRDTAGMDYDDNAKLYAGADYPAAEEGIYGAELLTLDASGELPEDIELSDADDAEEQERWERMSGTEEASDDGKKARKLTRDELECWLVADRIRSMVQEGLPVYDRKEKTTHPVRYRDIAILARSAKGFADPIKKIFSEYAIPVHTGAQTGFFQTREVRLMMNVLRVIDNPMQDIPLYDVLTGYLGLYTEEGIAGLREKDRKASLYQLVREAAGAAGPETDQRAKHFLAWSEEKSRKAGYMTVRELLEELLAEGDYLDRVTALPGGAQRRENLLSLLEKASDYEKTSYRGLYSFVRYVERIREAGIEEGEAEILDENADVVHLMTIHKSKGLEFPVCFCIGFSKRLKKTGHSVKCRMDAEYGIALDAIDPVARTCHTGLKKLLLERKESEEETAEQMRILYVALTRAMEKLIITDVKKDADTAAPPKPERHAILHVGSLMDWIRMALGAEDHVRCTGKCLRIEDLSENIRKDTARATAGLEALYAADLPVDRKLADELREARERVYPHPELAGLYTKTTVSELKRAAYEDEEAWNAFAHEEREEYVPAFVRTEDEGYAGAKRGSAYHRFLELLDLTTMPSDGPLESWLNEEAQRMKKAGTLTEEEESLLQYKRFLSFIRSETAGRMHRAALRKKLFREQPFFYGVPAVRLDPSFPASETILVQGVIDVYWEEEDALVLLDYKTDRVKEAEELIKRYRAQLRIYAEALSQITGKPVCEALIWSFALERAITVQIDIPV